MLNSCQWTGSGHRISSNAKQAFYSHLEAGKGLVVMHCSIGNWDDWPEYRDLVGAVWKWGENGSKHSSPDAEFEIEVLEQHPIVEGIPLSFKVIDEMYYDLDLAENNNVIARTKDAFGSHPMVWYRRTANTNVAAIMMGHDEHACSHPQYIHLFKNACTYTVGGDKNHEKI